MGCGLPQQDGPGARGVPRTSAPGKTEVKLSPREQYVMPRTPVPGRAADLRQLWGIGVETPHLELTPSLG